MKSKISKKEFLNEIKKFQHPRFVIELKKEENVLECKVICNLNDLKIPIPVEEPSMTVGNLTIEQLTNIISNIFDKKFDEKIKPISNEISLIKQQMVTKEYLDQRLKPIEEDIKMLKSFHTKEIQEYHKNNK
ncbi:MAG: hypothetical protein ACTTJO_00115 [Metamycoplasmataceae bacterium]